MTRLEMLGVACLACLAVVYAVGWAGYPEAARNIATVLAASLTCWVLDRWRAATRGR